MTISQTDELRKSANKLVMGEAEGEKSAIALLLQPARKALTTICLLLIIWFSIGLPSSLNHLGDISLASNHLAYAEELSDFEDVAPATPTFNTSDIQVDDISSEKISQFVQAYVQVVELIDQREDELQQAETESESLRIQHDIVAEAFSKIEDTGLSQQEYLQLLGLANIDPEFGERIATQLEEMRP